MTDEERRRLVREIISTCRYLTLSTSHGTKPWAAPIEYLCDDDLNFYFLSPAHTRHAEHIARNPDVALAIFDTKQPEYTSDVTAQLRGVQIEGSARRLPVEECPREVLAVVQALKPPMPPYEVFRVTPTAFYVPTIVNGINERVAVEMRSVSDL